MTKHVAFYLRVSTGEQMTENQRRELEAVARHRGWEIVAVYEDQGISGAKGRDKRPQFDRMLKDAVRGRFDIFAAWAVDRLGRSLQDLVVTLGELKAAGVDLFPSSAGCGHHEPEWPGDVPDARCLRRV